MSAALPYRMTLKRASNSYTVSLFGEIDYAASLDLYPKLNSITQLCGRELLFDLSNVTLLDSEGLKVLLAIYERMREKDGTARVVRCSKSAKRLLSLSGVDCLLGLGETAPDQDMPEQSPDESSAHSG